MKNSIRIQKKNINPTDFTLDLSGNPKIMGILNVTPDSFYDGGKYSDSIDAAVNHGMQLIKDGTHILDIGGESTRPGATPVSESEEIDRIVPVIEGIRIKSDIPISVDTYKSKVADYAMQAGANWINDISGLRFDDSMIQIVEKWNCPVIVMHTQGMPQSMQVNPQYDNVMLELLNFFEERIEKLNKFSINNIILDPGIGFGKTLNHNLEILNQIKRFQKFGFPILVGASRKSFIGNILDSDVENRLAGSLAVLSWLVINNVDILRVHDVKESLETVKVLRSILKIENNHN